MSKVTKTEIVIRIMRENLGRPMAEVLPLLQAEFGWNDKNARAAYCLRVKADPSLGAIEKATKATSLAKVVGPKTVKIMKATAKVKAPKAPKESKSASRIAEIRAENLRRMKEVAARRPTPIAVDTSDEAMAGFEMPKFLTKGQLKELL
jgi:hypothetical protein